jgi:hypothetical protein
MSKSPFFSFSFFFFFFASMSKSPYFPNKANKSIILLRDINI